MNIKTLFTTALFIACNTGLVAGSAHAADTLSFAVATKSTNTLSATSAINSTAITRVVAAPVTTGPDNLILYQFAPQRAQTIDDSSRALQTYLANESSKSLQIGEDKVVRYVSDKDVNTTFEHDLASGDISFQRDFSRYQGSYVPKLPSGDEAVSYAKRFLVENKLAPKNADELTLAHIGGLRASYVINGKTAGPVIDKLVTLTFGRAIRDVPVIGPGSKFVINIGEKGEVVGLIKRWRELSTKTIPLRATEVYSEKEALELARKSIATEFGDGASFEVLQSQVAYYDKNGSYLQPVYAIETEVTLDDQSAAPFRYVSVIQAMKAPKEDLMLTATDELATTTLKRSNTIKPSAVNKTFD